jgi:phosphatase NudJ
MSGQIVCAGLIEKNDKYLMVQESKDNIFGLWNLPAGRLEGGENLQECVKREVFEETGVEAEPTGIVGMYFHDSGDEVTSIIVYDMNHMFGDPNPNHDDVQKSQWLSEEQIKEKELRSYHINQAISDFKSRDRIPCSYVERIEDLDPSKLGKLKMKFNSKRPKVSEKGNIMKGLISTIILYLGFNLIKKIRNYDM